jgi:hypothetical protein
VLPGWKCCKPRVLTFEEFMSIPPCTEGKHSTTDLPPEIEKSQPTNDTSLLEKIEAAAPRRAPIASTNTTATPPLAPALESEDDDPSLEISDGRICRRKACGQAYKKGQARDTEKCVHHPGVPIFHEGSKGYSCCKRRVLEFDQFMKIKGCKTSDRHLFVGSGKKSANGGGGQSSGGEERLDSVRWVHRVLPVSPAASSCVADVCIPCIGMTFTRHRPQ